MYYIGQKITTKYSDPPIMEKNQYKIGQYIDITDIDTDMVLAVYIVESSSDTIIKGKIIWTKE